jgi:4-diphosphocytidyl-2-C-methyl-D-erythritol kinase
MIKEKAYAKINLFLNVLSKRLDGYHEMEMIMTPLKLHDVLKFEKVDENKIEIVSNKEITKINKDNLVYKVASFLKSEFEIETGVRIHIEKNIPIAGGLAGGSADAAATIRGMNRLFDLGMDSKKMAEIAVGFGADVPFCVYNKLAIVKGIGEKLQFLKTKFKANVLLVNPQVPVITKTVFDNLDPSQFAQKNYAELIEGLKDRDISQVINNLYNFMESTTFILEPKVKELKDEIQELGVKGVLMSGSGSTIFVVCRNKKVLKDIATQINRDYLAIMTKTF